MGVNFVCIWCCWVMMGEVVLEAIEMDDMVEMLEMVDVFEESVSRWTRGGKGGVCEGRRAGLGRIMGIMSNEGLCEERGAFPLLS